MLPNAGENVEKPDCSYTAGGSINGSATLENSLIIFHKVQHTLTVHSHSWVFTGEKWKLRFTQKSAAVYPQQLYSSVKNQKWPRCSSMAEQLNNVVCPNHRKLLSLKTKWTTETGNNLGELCPQRLHTVWFHLHNILENYGSGEQISGGGARGEEGHDAWL